MCMGKRGYEANDIKKHSGTPPNPSISSEIFDKRNSKVKLFKSRKSFSVFVPEMKNRDYTHRLTVT